LKGRSFLSSFSSRLSGELKRYLDLKWTGPFLVVPVLFVALLFIESWMQRSGFMPYTAVKQRGALSAWKMIALVSAVGIPVNSIFMHGGWRQARGGASTPAFFGGTCFAGFLVMLIAVGLGTGFILMPMGIPFSAVARVIFPWGIFVLLWAASASALSSSMTSSIGAAVLSLGLFSLALLPGLTGTAMSRWMIPPIGEMTQPGAGWSQALAIIGHAMAYFAAGGYLSGRISAR
jgi:hypothetical protein